MRSKLGLRRPPRCNASHEPGSLPDGAEGYSPRLRDRDSGAGIASVELVAEVSAVADGYAHARHRPALGHPGEELARHLGQDRPRQDVIHVARAAFDLLAAPQDLVDDGVVVAERGAVVLLQPAPDPT